MTSVLSVGKDNQVIHRTIILCGVGLMGLWIGILARYAQWESAAQIHSVFKMRNAEDWGERSSKFGYLNIYTDSQLDIVRKEMLYPDWGLDYPPLRLMIFTLWAKWLDHYHPEAYGPASFAMNQPLLLFNGAMEEGAALGVFLLVRNWSRQSSRVQRTPLALAAALFLWLNPALIINSWGEPAWDVWILPFYLFSILLASSGWWISSGIVLAVGAMFKGQMLAVAPLFVLWPMFARQYISACRLTAGFAVGVAVIVSPWMFTRGVPQNNLVVRVTDWPAIVWGISVVLWLSLALLYRRFQDEHYRRWWSITFIVTGIYLGWPAVHLRRWMVVPISGLFLGIFFLTQRIPRKHVPALVATVFAGSVFA